MALDLEGIPKPVHVSQHEDTNEAAMVLKSGRPNTDPEDRQDGRRLSCWCPVLNRNHTFFETESKH